MDEYISRETAVKKLQMQLLNLEADQDKGEYSELCENRGARDALDEAIYDIRTIKAADVQPVKRGFWKALMMSEETGWDLSLTGGHDTVCEYVCSVCDKPNIVDEFGDSYLPNFCPNCGARMVKDGERNG